MPSPAHTIFGATRLNAPGYLAGVDFTPDGCTLVALGGRAPGERTKVVRFGIADGKLIEERSVPGYWSEIVCLPDGGCLVWSSNSVARLDAADAVLWKVKEKTSNTPFFFVSALRDGSLFATSVVLEEAVLRPAKGRHRAKRRDLP